MYNLKKEDDNAISPGKVFEEHEPYCEDFKSVKTAVLATMRAILNIIFACPSHMAAEQRIAVF